MKPYDNSSFYNSTRWRRVSAAYMASRHYICERCGKPAVICHHRRYLNGENVNDPAISLAFENLEALCLECHNAEHGSQHGVTLFDGGAVAGVKETPAARDFLRQREQINSLLERLEKNEADSGPSAHSTGQGNIKSCQDAETPSRACQGIRERERHELR